MFLRSQGPGFCFHHKTYGYNTRGQITLYDGPRTDVSDITSFSYDSVTGDLTSIGFAGLGSISISEYDLNGNPGRIIDLNGVEIILTWDVLNRLQTKTLVGAGSAGGDMVTVFTYDSTGALSSVLLPEGNAVALSYDKVGRVVAIDQKATPGAAPGISQKFEYDTEGNLTRVAYHDAQGATTYFKNYSYDEYNRMIREENPDQSYTEYSYGGGGKSNPHRGS